MNVVDLKDTELDFWVARASGIEVHPHPNGMNDQLIIVNEAAVYGFYTYMPSRSWRQAGPIIEREKIAIQRTDTQWEACKDKGDMRYRFTGKSPLVAAMKCFIASKFGENLPAENYHFAFASHSAQAGTSRH